MKRNNPNVDLIPESVCVICFATGEVPKSYRARKCGGCKLVNYCSRKHQSLHWPTHKESCKTVKHGLALIEIEEEALSTWPGDMVTPANPRVNAVGKFYASPVTQVYMKVRFGHLKQLWLVNTHESVSKALDHSIDLLRLNLNDDLNIRTIVPGLMLQLGKDQECYDFVKYWATCDPDGDRDWTDTARSHLHLKGEDMFEDDDFLTQSRPMLSHLVAFTLIKSRLILDIMDLQTLCWLAQAKKLPIELVIMIIKELLRPATAQSRHVQQNCMDIYWLQSCETRLTKSVTMTYLLVNSVNKHFWPRMLQPEYNMKTGPQAASTEEEEEVEMTLGFAVPAWRSSFDALTAIADIHSNMVGVDTSIFQ